MIRNPRSSHEGKDVNFSKVFFSFLFFVETVNWKQSHGMAFKENQDLACGPQGATCRVLINRLIFVLLDSDSGKLYVIFKYFLDTDTTAKSVSSNSSSKNSDTVI